MPDVRLGQKQTFAAHKTMSALPLIATVKADIAVPTEGGASRISLCDGRSVSS